MYKHEFVNYSLPCEEKKDKETKGWTYPAVFFGESKPSWSENKRKFELYTHFRYCKKEI